MDEIKDDKDYASMTGVAIANLYASSGDTVTLPLDPPTIDKKPIQGVDHTEQEKEQENLGIPVKIRITEQDDVRGFYALMQVAPVYCLPDGTYLISSSFLDKLDNGNISYELC